MQQPIKQQGVQNQPTVGFDYEEFKRKAQQCLYMLTTSQQIVADTVIQDIISGESHCVFFNARGGTGKTFLLNTPLAAIRTMADTKQMALVVASSRIAATLLHKDRTFHYRFKAQLKPQKDSTLYNKTRDTLTQLIKMTKLIIWDEAPMIHRYHLKVFNRTQKAITRSQKTTLENAYDSGRRLDRFCQ